MLVIDSIDNNSIMIMNINSITISSSSSMIMTIKHYYH